MSEKSVTCDECKKIIVSKAYCFWCHNNIDAHAVLDYERKIQFLNKEIALLKRMSMAVATKDVRKLQEIVNEMMELEKKREVL